MTVKMLVPVAVVPSPLVTVTLRARSSPRLRS